MGTEHLSAHTSIMTAAPESLQIALNELHRTGAGIEWLGALGPGIGRVRSQAGHQALVRRLRQHSPVFIRHICPAQLAVALDHTSADVARLADAAERLAGFIDPAVSFSVQTRSLYGGKDPYSVYDLNDALAKRVQAIGADLDVRHPTQVVSVVCGNDKAFLGVSLAADNLSVWSGGVHRFARQAEQISRAEFKLLEAIDLFGICVKRGDAALDLGAAPGGWTRVLRSLGAHVTAVDPAELAPSLQSDDLVLHHRETAQAYLRHPDTFDIIVNDMKMDVGESVALMNTAAHSLRPGGIGVMTLKLPERQQERLATLSLSKLRHAYEIIGARQLFHNRSEVTVALRPI